MATVSIIVPIYNTGKYLNKCVDSLLNQTLQEVEIIMVDDGSNEETATICDEQAARDSRIKVFHKQNEGVSIARNYALERATGKYIGFVDSDDWVDTFMFQTLVNVLESQDVDVVYCDATTVWDEGRTELDTFSTLSSSVALETRSLSPRTLCQMAGSAWRGLFKSSTLREYNICFPEGLKFSEDRIFNLLVLSHTSRIYYLKKSFYFRYMRDDSCVNSYHPDAYSIVLRSSRIMQQLVSNHWGEEHRRAYLQQMVTELIGYLYGVITRPSNETSRYQEFCDMASTSELHEAIITLCRRDIRSSLIVSEHYRMLYLLMQIHSFYKQISA